MSYKTLNMNAQEMCCMEPENYLKIFKSFYWKGPRSDNKIIKKFKKDKYRRVKSFGILALSNSPALLSNPSQFSVFAAVRKTILTRWTLLQNTAEDQSDDSDSDDMISTQSNIMKLPKVTAIGLRTVFTLVSQSRFSNEIFCEQALKALLDVLQGHLPEELFLEPAELILSLHSMLVEISSGTSVKSELSTPLTAASSSCLIALSVARGEAELILNAAASLIMSPPALSDQDITIPSNLTALQRSVQAAILGTPSRNNWLHYGVPHQSLVTSFPVDLPSELTSMQGDLIVRSLTADGCFLYVYTAKGLLKIGSGYGSSIKQHVYEYKSDFFPTDRHGWIGFCKGHLYVRMGRKKQDIYQVDNETLELKNVIRLDPGQQTLADPKTAVFTDGTNIGMISLTNHNSLSVKLYNPEHIASGTTLMPVQELDLQLMRRRTLIFGWAPFEEIERRRIEPRETVVASQIEDCEDDRVVGISAGQDFALLRTSNGRVYYSGKSSSIGYKVASPSFGRWNLLKETQNTNKDIQNAKKYKIIQVAVGHEGVHAVLLTEDGTAMFMGVARRGEDGDLSKHRRTPKPTRPKRMAENHLIVYAACNYGSTALVTKQGALLMFGKDNQHCDANGVVTALKHERIVQVSLGKAHAVALSSQGLVFTFGINNKGQCGREFGYASYAKEKVVPKAHAKVPKLSKFCPHEEHVWRDDYCRVCTMCCECSGFSTDCEYTDSPKRVPKEHCGCGEGDSGCVICGLCRRCDEIQCSGKLELEEDDDKEATKSESSSGMDSEKEGNVKITCLPPARIAIPGGHKVAMISCGLHHTVVLTEHGEVMTFGSNSCGQLGAGDISIHHRIIRVRTPKASAVSAGSNHTVVMTKEGEIYTFGNYQKGALGRQYTEEPVSRSDRDRQPIWYALPGKVPRLGPHHSCKAVWIAASGDQTFIQISQALIKTEILFSSTITANKNTIVILPNRPEHTFKCITINKADGSCYTHTGPEQVDFVNSLACLDPLYEVMWCYQPQMKVIKCYNILAFDSHRIQKCAIPDTEMQFNDNKVEYPNYGCMRRLDEFKCLQTLETIRIGEDNSVANVILTNMSILNQELAIPCIMGVSVTRMHAALHLLACLDSLTFAHDSKLVTVECKRSYNVPSIPTKEDFITVNRFDSHGGGWGYSGHSVEAIRFMCDSDILLGGYGLFGGRGDYTAKIKLFDLGMDGGDQEGDGELLAESDEIVYECAPRDKFAILFDSPVPLVAGRWYVAWACISGPSSDCGSSGQTAVINDDIVFHFKTSKKSNNGTDVNAGQIPCLLYNTVTPDQIPPVRTHDSLDPVITLSKNLSRRVTVNCFRSLIVLLQWSWKTFKDMLLETNGQIPITFQKLSAMKHQKRLVYVIRACLRIAKSYINEIYPPNAKRRNSIEFMSYFDAIADVRNLVQTMLSEQMPTCGMLPKRSGKTRSNRICYVQFALEMMNSILSECHNTINSCFHAFLPTPTLKWNHLCSLLFHVKNGAVPPKQARELMAICGALCVSRSLRDVLQHALPATRRQIDAADADADSKPAKCAKPAVPAKSATVPRVQQRPPPIPPRSSIKDKTKQTSEGCYTEWTLLEVVSRLLDIVTGPIKGQMMTRQCGQPHDHGEAQLTERLCAHGSKMVSRIVAELAYAATVDTEDTEIRCTNNYLSTPSRFMRMNQSRTWNTGNGSPDAICFTVDRPGVFLVGIAVYTGIGSYDYELEILNDGNKPIVYQNDSNPALCWVSMEVFHGSLSSSDSRNEVVEIKFQKAIPLKENLRYAIRLCNHGGRTASGECGLPSVKGPDGTTFRFSSCPLCFNGTTLTRGQIPYLLYQSTNPIGMNTNVEGTDSMLAALRTITLRVASMILDKMADVFRTLRNELTVEDLKRNAYVLQQSPTVNILVPYILANLEVFGDSKSQVQILEMIAKLVPHVAAMNQLVPSSEEPPPQQTTSHYYTWVESDHPYKQATVTNMRVLFPPSVTWMTLEMDNRSITAQPEDSLSIYAVAAAPRHHCHCAQDPKFNREPFRKKLLHLPSGNNSDSGVHDYTAEESPCYEYNCTYMAISPKMSNLPSEWPQKAIIVPGNELIFSLETASDYLNEYKANSADESRYGFRCLCVGYEDTAVTVCRRGLSSLEMELAFAGAACASKLLSPVIDIPPLNQSTLAEVQIQSLKAYNSNENDETAPLQDSNEILLLSGGLELPSPPTIHQILSGQPLVRSLSTERQFLADFIGGIDSTAGGRLSSWLQPEPRVDPTKSEVNLPTGVPRAGTPVIVSVAVRDQYGELAISPALIVEVLIQLEDTNGISKGKRTTELDPQMFGGHPVPRMDLRYQPTIKDNMCFQAITMMKSFHNYSFEELRLAAPTGPTAPRVPPERLVVRAQSDGSYTGIWLPRVPGHYVIKCTLDEKETQQELRVDVKKAVAVKPKTIIEASLLDQAPPLQIRPVKLRRFSAAHTAGLRIRARPSLQAEEIGIIPKDTNISYIEEIQNNDGTWVRLSPDAVRAFISPDIPELDTLIATNPPEAWCLQFNTQLNRTLLWPVDAESENKNEIGSKDKENLIKFTEYIVCAGGLGNAPLQNDCYLDVLTSNELEEPTKPEKDENVFNFNQSAQEATLEYIRQFDENKMFMATDEPGDNDSSDCGAVNNSNGNCEDWYCVGSRRTRPLSDGGVDSFDDIEDLNNCIQAGYKGLPSQSSFEKLFQGQPSISLTAKEPATKNEKWRPLASKGRTRKVRVQVNPMCATSSNVPRPLVLSRASSIRYAISPSQADCLRTIFAALLWHEGIIHDAMACAAFLKFHPQLPKQGARVVTRTAAHSDLNSPKTQRHSVEVSGTGNSLHIQPSTLESLTRSAINANANRIRSKRISDAPPISEEDAVNNKCIDMEDGRATVMVLPPALRALVALWDTLCQAKQLGIVPECHEDKENCGNIQNNIEIPTTSSRRKKDSKLQHKQNTPYSVFCELCGGGAVQPPLAVHMRNAHGGCGTDTARGYDRAGAYLHTPMLNACGQLAQASAYYLWFIYCEQCRDKCLKAASHKQGKAKNIDDTCEQVDVQCKDYPIDHNRMLENAAFLLDLTPITSAEPTPAETYQQGASLRDGSSPPSPPNSVWLPAPLFQCFDALGANSHEDDTDFTRFDSLRRPAMGALTNAFSEATRNLEQSKQELLFPSHSPRFHRSVSMGQAGGSNFALDGSLAHNRNGNLAQEENLTGGGSSLLSQPSQALQKLVGCGKTPLQQPSGDNVCSVSAFESPKLDTEALLQRPVLAFVVGRRDLDDVRQKADAVVRIATVRQYALEALNWLLRSVTQATCLHDVMWWFCVALEHYYPFVCANDNRKCNFTVDGLCPRPPAAALSPGGRAGRGVRGALYTFLHSVAALMPALPAASAVLLQAVRCWALEYAPSDHAFLHRSQVFSVISRILSHSEDDIYDDAVAREVAQDSYHSYINKDGFVWACQDITVWCDLSVSSRQGMLAALTDGSTETFWESGEEDRNKVKWVQVTGPVGGEEDKPHLVCLHIDNTRDTVNKTMLLTFVYSGHTTELYHFEDTEVGTKNAEWICYALPRGSGRSARVRCELRGPDGAVRVRQVRVLSVPRPLPQPPPARIMHQCVDAETLTVFRLITQQFWCGYGHRSSQSQTAGLPTRPGGRIIVTKASKRVFGKLLEWESSSDGEGAARPDGHDETDLREHVVGILFAGSKLTNLQKQVMRHIVMAIGSEAEKAREDWESALICSDEDTAGTPDDSAPDLKADSYCFEMLSLLLALSGSTVGRSQLAQRVEMISDLLSLLHTGSDRVQRQIISLLRRMAGEIQPHKMLAAINHGNESSIRISLIDHLVTYLAKAITVQVKTKGGAATGVREAGKPTSVTMGTAIVGHVPGYWFMRGRVSKKHAHLVAKLLADMAEDKLSPQWGSETRTALAGYALRLAGLPERDRAPQVCVGAPPLWFALATLCVCEESHVHLINSGFGNESHHRSSRGEGRESRPLCVNHDDGETGAMMECGSCGPLCQECDRFLHLNRAARTHHRQICKEEESTIRIDIHEGCGRAKLFWLLLLIDRRTLKALAEFRVIATRVSSTEAEMECAATTGAALVGTCRFCGTHASSGLLAIGNVCADHDCQEHGRNACVRVLGCGHMCGGVLGERTCLPCLFGCAGSLRQDADDMCMICFTDPLQAAPSIQLQCGHVFHLHCCRKVLLSKWIGPRITFSFAQCPICKDDMDHPVLEEQLGPIRQLKEEVRKKALMRLEYEGLRISRNISARYANDPEAYAMDRYAYYVCYKCGKAYFGGLARCEAESSAQYDPAELVCGACSDVAGARSCPKHGADFLEYKCRYCCSVAVFFCFGTSHFCNACHDDFQRVTNIPKHMLPRCPAGPKASQLDGTSEDCPLHIKHPPTGEEFALGCGVCRNSHTF